jgi:Protein of unknown function (DUF504).
MQNKENPKQAKNNKNTMQVGFYYESDEDNNYDETYEEAQPTETKKANVVPKDEEEDDLDYEPNQNVAAYDISLAGGLEAKRGKKFKNVNHEEEEDSDYEEEVDENGVPTKTYAKFRGADKIYHRILWDESLNKSEFVVGYEDRFEGIIEEPFENFEVLKEDIPFHRIRYFKRNGEVVWDRRIKLNKL